jgi:hypothetical protein
MKAVDKCADTAEQGAAAVELQGQQLDTAYPKLNR